MIRVTTSSVIDAPADAVWAAIRDFNALPDWQPGIVKSTIEDGGSADRIGCVRALTLANRASSPSEWWGSPMRTAQSPTRS